MAGWHPLRRREFIRRLLALGFAGPYSGARHDFLIFRQRRQTIPSNTDYSVPPVKMLVRQVEGMVGRKISAEEWADL
jgi:hypothetical protein